MVGAAGFEPATSCSRSRRATGLRYAPPTNLTAHAPGGTRIPNLLIRSQMLYPIELRARNEIRRLPNDRPSRSKTDTDYRPHPLDRQPVHHALITSRRRFAGARWTQWNPRLDERLTPSSPMCVNRLCAEGDYLAQECTLGRNLAGKKKTKPPAQAEGNLNERYKTRTCDLHDVNVAL
jgi:hypothetical protein